MSDNNKQTLRNSENLRGDKSFLWGDAKGISGEASGITGCVTQIEGNVTKICGDVSQLMGDITHLRGDVTNLSWLSMPTVESVMRDEREFHVTQAVTQVAWLLERSDTAKQNPEGVAEAVRLIKLLLPP